MTEVLSKWSIWDTIKLLKMDSALWKIVTLSTILHPISHIIKDYNGIILTSEIENYGANISSSIIGRIKLVALIPLILL